MLLGLAIFAFGIPLIYVIVDNKKRKQELKRQLEIVQKQIAEKERSSNSEEHGADAPAKSGEQNEEP